SPCFPRGPWSPGRAASGPLPASVIRATATRRGFPASRCASSSMADRLALHGGVPVRASTLPYARQTVDEVDVQAVAAALRSDWLTTGPGVEAFERAVASRVEAT